MPFQIAVIIIAGILCQWFHRVVCRQTDTLTKVAIGWWFASSYVLSILSFYGYVPTNVPDWKLMPVMLGIVFVPAFPLGFGAQTFKRVRFYLAPAEEF